MKKLLTFTRRSYAAGFQMFITDQDGKDLGTVSMDAGVPIFEPRAKLLIEAELRAIAAEMRMIGTRR